MNNLDAPVNITNGPQGINRVDTFSIGEFAFGRSQSLFGFRITGPEKYYYLLLLLVIVIVVICRSEEHTSELQSLMRISYAVFCLKKKNTISSEVVQLHESATKIKVQ